MIVLYDTHHNDYNNFTHHNDYHYIVLYYTHHYDFHNKMLPTIDPFLRSLRSTSMACSSCASRSTALANGSSAAKAA